MHDMVNRRTSTARPVPGARLPAAAARRRTLRVLAAAGGAAALLLSGCSSTTTTAPTGSASSAAPVSSNAALNLASLYKSTSTEPTGDPLKAVSGKTLFVISCGQSLTVCSEPVQGVVDAANLLGWKTTVYDTQTDPVKFAQGVSQGIASKPDAIVMSSIDCSLVQNQVQAAIAANIKIMTMQSIDCSDAVGGGGASLYTNREPAIKGFATFADFQRASNAQQSAWVGAKSNGAGQVLELDNKEYPVYQAITAGETEGFTKYCSGCTVNHLEFSFTDAGAKLQQKVQQALLQYPKTNYIVAPDDSTVLSGVSAAVAASKKQASVQVVGGGAAAANLDLIRSNGGQNMTNAWVNPWFGWAAVDSLNSVFQDKPIRDSGLGWQVIDSSNVPTGAYVSPIDYQATYKRLWGLS